MTETLTAPEEQTETEPQDTGDLPMTEGAIDQPAAEEAKEPQPAPVPEKAAEPFDIVKGVEKYIANAIDHALCDEDTVTAKIIAQRSKVARLNIAMLRMDQGKKTVKEMLENETEHLDSMERDAQMDVEAKRIQPDLPFGERAAEPAEDDAWRSVRLDSLSPSLTPGTLKALADHKPPIETIGAVSDWVSAKSVKHGGENRLSDVPRIGPEADRKICDAIDAYWRENPRELAAKSGEGDGQLHPSASGGEKVQPSVPVPAASIGLTEDRIRAAFYPKLESDSKGNKPPVITDTIKVDGVHFVAVPASLMSAADYVLVPISAQPIDNPPANDRYAGVLVLINGEKQWLGTAAHSIAVTIKTAPEKPNRGRKATAGAHA